MFQRVRERKEGWKVVVIGDKNGKASSESMDVAVDKLGMLRRNDNGIPW